VHTEANQRAPGKFWFSEIRRRIVMDKKKLGFWAPILVLAAALIMLAVGTDAVDAAKGGKGGGKPGGGGTPPATGTCQVTPDPAARWSAVTISGAGFPAGAVLGLTIRSESGNVAMTFATADATGRLSTKYNTVWLGTNAVTVSGGGVTATCAFRVV
jgi:hypothetical protein